MQLVFCNFQQTVSRMWDKNFAFKILIFLNIYGSAVAKLTCHHCHGINCLRTTYKATQKCITDLDICVTVFNGQTVEAQGCLEQLSEELREKCYSGIETNNQDSAKLNECFKCNENLCNNFASESFKCIQCDVNSDVNCSSKAENLIPTRCLVSRTPNEYCFVKREAEGIVRGCSYTLEEQIDCLSSEDCMLCQASEIRGCNAVSLTENNMESSGSGNDNSSSGGEAEGSSEGESTNGNGGIDGSDNGASDGNPGDGNEENEDTGSGISGSDSENNVNGNNSSSGENSESGVGSNGNSVIIVHSYIYILTLNMCLYSMLARK